MLPTFANLNQRKIPVDPTCPICKCKRQTILHGLWSCSHLKLVRSEWYQKLAGNHKGKVYFIDFILDCFSRLKKEDLELFCVCLWKVWSLRNDVVHNSINEREIDVVGWASCFIVELHNANSGQNRILVVVTI
ncbi:hypothetical protein Dsin_004683 [Dipteronia sinensis]|uniref:Reverse transcriptase zinc-binding domain-containing protein n=1 Tax=Dipteronia sinensis TaxID=43782 RepID=A0AAE0AV17_9ROSI|nr:hypothetical protein Dsin_004683 [Dipteronia sinensis]